MDGWVGGWVAAVLHRGVGSKSTLVGLQRGVGFGVTAKTC